METTEVWIVENLSTKEQLYPQLQKPAVYIRQDNVVAFPTETVYGLGANALSAKGVEKIYTAKGRPSDNPLIVHISSVDMLDDLVSEIPATAQKLIEVFWPGPLTIIFPKKKEIPSSVTGGLSTVGVRMPDHAVALAFIEAAGVPIAAPSANISGRPSPTQIRHVIEDMNGRIPAIIDGGATKLGIESTVIDCSVPIPVILRPGHITKSALEAVLNMKIQQVGDVKETGQSRKIPKSPGMKYRHYAPQAPLMLVPHSLSALQAEIQKQKLQNKRVGVLTTEAFSQRVEGADRIYSLGNEAELDVIGHYLYDGLRNFDDYQMDVIIATDFLDEGIGQAIMNRLRKASEHVVSPDLGSK